MSSPSLTIFPTTGRHIKPSTQSAFLGSTLNTKDTIRAYLALHPSPILGDRPFISSLTTLLALEHGINGLANMAHGGLTCVLMDDAMGQLLMANRNVDEEGSWASMVTGELKTKFLKSVRTPQIVVVRAEMKEVKGKKCWMETELVDEGGEVLARSEAVWIVVGGPEGEGMIEGEAEWDEN